MGKCGVFPAAACKDLAGSCFPFVCQAEKGGDIKDIEDNFVQESDLPVCFEGSACCLFSSLQKLKLLPS